MRRAIKLFRRLGLQNIRRRTDVLNRSTENHRTSDSESQIRSDFPHRSKYESFLSNFFLHSIFK